MNFMGSNGGTIWFSGLHGSGKTTIANALAEKLREKGVAVVLLDGDVIRERVSADLGYSKEERNTHIKRVAGICEIITSNNVLNIACVASPTQEVRDYAKKIIPVFLEVYVKCPLEVCEKRDVKGHYMKARAREKGFENFLGVNLPYEEPKNPDLVLCTDRKNPKESVERLFNFLLEKQWIQP
ncbi:MAG: adenylyl-sulfate kinase [Candidatus Diapherotrites archaeon]|nr:adenylyl-sulfate kinase [Candidatus Diapherotrites archaeon]